VLVVKCRVCNFQIPNDFQLVCDMCTKREEELEAKEAEEHYLDEEVCDCLEGEPTREEFAEAKRQEEEGVVKKI